MHHLINDRFNMMPRPLLIILFLVLFSGTCTSLLAHDEVIVKEMPKAKEKGKKSKVIDSIPPAKKPMNHYDSAFAAHQPKKAAIRSAILPGLGQIYNKKYWKLPIVYGALGISGGIFFYNLKNYKDTRFAYKVKYNMRVFQTDSALFSKIKPNLQPLGEESLRFYRNQFRRDIDYSVLFMILLWGLNVVDAAVDAHLKTFDVSPDLSLQFKPGYSELARTNGLSLIIKIGK
ncbi:MAG TPA: DUF5683 domain-containing protein [Chitinophagaceae bacterium]|nr:DUF5683 domain-containing protein [Chitinophagaceae bacterium]